MSRLKSRRAHRAATEDDALELQALRAELEARLDQLRTTIERKRRQGWTVVRAAGATLEETSGPPVQVPHP